MDKSEKIGYNIEHMQNAGRSGRVKYKKSVFRNLAMVTQLGISVLVDSRYGMNTLVPLLILGVLAGAKSAWHLAMRTLMQECREDETILQKRESQKERTGSSRPKQPSRIRRD